MDVSAYRTSLPYSFCNPPVFRPSIKALAIWSNRGSFQPQKGLVTQLPYKADGGSITVVRTGMEDKNYLVKRVEFKPQKSGLSVRAPATPEEKAFIASNQTVRRP